MRSWLVPAAFLVLIVAPGCFYPPVTPAPPESKTSAVVGLPYDLAWDAVNEVIVRNGLTVQVSNPNHGIIEASGKPFTLQDADCGKIKSIVGSYPAEPETDSTSVYNFYVKPVDNEHTAVSISGTFDSPLKIPLRRPEDVDCVSRGSAESHLLRAILAQVTQTHPPEYQHPAQPPPVDQHTSPSIDLMPRAPAAIPTPLPLLPGRPTLLKPDMLPPPPGMN